MLYVNHSRPERDERVEEKWRESLRLIDPLLDIRWFESIAFNPRAEEPEGRYGIVVNWPSIDPRWQLIREGALGNEPYDILMWLTEDEHDASSASTASVESIEARVINILATADNSRIPWKDRMKATMEKNRKLRAAAKRDLLEGEIHDLASYEYNRALDLPIVSVLTDIKG